jgi:hypothetical protein
VCAFLDNTTVWKGTKAGLLGDPTSGFMYAITPTVACTFWKRIFHVLAQRVSTTSKVDGTKALFKLDRLAVHAPIKHTHTYNLAKALDRQAMSDGFAFMFTRDPYSRLWSAYLDKFYLPNFWHLVYDDGIMSFQTKHKNPSKSCGDDVTLTDFLKYVVISDQTGSSDGHWQAQYKLCLPCHVAYDVIGKQETFTDDAWYVLGQVGRGDILKGYNFSSTVQTEMSSLIKTNLIHLKSKIKPECVNRTDISCRLWKVFQLNGYLPPTVGCPRVQLQKAGDDDIVRELIDLAISEYRSNVVSTSDSKEQKRMAMYSAYHDIPVELLNQVRDVYKLDFKLINYDPEPPEIFQRTSYTYIL